jgi:hypothetical protein
VEVPVGALRKLGTDVVSGDHMNGVIDVVIQPLGHDRLLGAPSAPVPALESATAVTWSAS